MRICTRVPLNVNDVIHEPGAVLDYPNAKAEKLIDKGWASRVTATLEVDWELVTKGDEDADSD